MTKAQEERRARNWLDKHGITWCLCSDGEVRVGHGSFGMWVTCEGWADAIQFAVRKYNLTPPKWAAISGGE